MLYSTKTPSILNFAKYKGKMLAPKETGQEIFGKREVYTKTYYCSHTIGEVSCSMYKGMVKMLYIVLELAEASLLPVCFYICIKYRSSLTDTLD